MFYAHERQTDRLIEKEYRQSAMETAVLEDERQYDLRNPEHFVKYQIVRLVEQNRNDDDLSISMDDISFKRNNNDKVLIINLHFDHYKNHLSNDSLSIDVDTYNDMFYNEKSFYETLALEVKRALSIVVVNEMPISSVLIDYVSYFGLRDYSYGKITNTDSKVSIEIEVPDLIDNDYVYPHTFEYDLDAFDSEETLKDTFLNDLKAKLDELP